MYLSPGQYQGRGLRIPCNDQTDEVPGYLLQYSGFLWK